MLEIEKLTVCFGDRCVLDDVSMSVKRGEVLGIVGESGSGKTMTVLSVMGLLNPQAQIKGGSIRLDGRLHGIPGSRSSAKEIKSRVLEALVDVKLPEPERIYESYPHELSGGMRQRVMIAMGTICRPGYLLCDEPTTALDVTTQKGIIELIRCMKDEHDMGIVFITHDLKLLKNFADKVIVMCRGRVVESGTVEEIFTSPRDEYTRGLIAAIPDRSRRIAGAQDVRMDTI